MPLWTYLNLPLNLTGFSVRDRTIIPIIPQIPRLDVTVLNITQTTSLSGILAYLARDNLLGPMVVDEVMMLRVGEVLPSLGNAANSLMNNKAIEFPTLKFHTVRLICGGWGACRDIWIYNIRTLDHVPCFVWYLVQWCRYNTLNIKSWQNEIPT